MQQLDTLLLKPNYQINSTLVSRCQAVEKVIHAMNERFEESLSMSSMANIAQLSPYHFNRVFRQIIGIPPTQYLYALRLEVAKRMLLTTQLNVTDICYEVGYNSIGSFTTRFTNLVGLSPCRFRNLTPSFATSSLNLLRHHCLGQSRVVPLNSHLTGKVIGPQNFSGLIFVGLFPTRIPQGRPVNCAILHSPGVYGMNAVPDGEYYVFAAAFDHNDGMSFLLNKTILRGVAGPILIRHGQIKGNQNVTLHPQQIFEPPLLVALPTLLPRLQEV